MVNIQSLSQRLHSAKLEYLGLAVAASSFCKELSERENVEIDFQSEGLPTEMSKEISFCLFHLLQELLQNAIQHSGSQHFQVLLIAGSGQIQLTVRDSGIGFDPKVVGKKRGLGLITMKERLKLVNGDLSIDSQLQRGTTIRARVPLTQSK
jgi:signal transduction histidine kinase